MARPTSSLFLANREYTLAPSMPRKTNTVISMVPLACSKIEDSEYSPVPPQKLATKTPPLKAIAATTMNTKIGTTLAIVAMRLITAASLTPRRIR